MSLNLFLACLTVFVSHTIEAVTGFGCTVLALPFVAALLGLTNGVIALTVVAWLLAVYFAIIKRKQIDFKQYAIIVLYMLIGIPIGIYLFRKLNTNMLKHILGLFICIISTWNLIWLLRNPESDKTPIRRALYYPLLIVGGIVHGMFSSGGPFAVLYSSKAIKDKGRFRATMCLLWASLNSIIITGYFFNGSFNAENVKIIGAFIPFLFAGIIAGEKIHDKLNPRVFSIITFSVLLLTGIIIFIQG